MKKAETVYIQVLTPNAYYLESSSDTNVLQCILHYVKQPQPSLHECAGIDYYYNQTKPLKVDLASHNLCKCAEYCILQHTSII